MVRHRAVVRAAVCLAACLAVHIGGSLTIAAAGFWTVRPFTEWTEKEARSIIEGSPWAAIVSVALPPAGPVPSGDMPAGGRGGGGRGGDDSFGPGPRRVRVNISWRSALPVKQALVRTQLKPGGVPSPDNLAFLAQAEQYYVIAVQGLPPQYVRPGDGAIVESFLRRSGKPPIAAQQAGSQASAGGATLLIGFPRTDAITVEDGDVEFLAKFDGLEVKRKFKLKDMLFGGTLAL